MKGLLFLKGGPTTRSDEKNIRTEMLKKPAIDEMCQDEMKDLLLELVARELRNMPADARCRRKELCEAILAANRETGRRAALCRDVCDAVKNWKAQNEQIARLEALGFTVIKGKKHYKLRWRDSGYFKALSASPSDCRTGANSVAETVSLFF